jgi:hypothetical protein
MRDHPSRVRNFISRVISRNSEQSYWNLRPAPSDYIERGPLIVPTEPQLYQLQCGSKAHLLCTSLGTPTAHDFASRLARHVLLLLLVQPLLVVLNRLDSFRLVAFTGSTAAPGVRWISRALLDPCKHGESCCRSHVDDSSVPTQDTHREIRELTPSAPW